MMIDYGEVLAYAMLAVIIMSFARAPLGCAIIIYDDVVEKRDVRRRLKKKL